MNNFSLFLASLRECRIFFLKYWCNLLFAAAVLLTLPACSSGSGGGSVGDGDNIPSNSAPVASNVSIADNNGGEAQVGDSLTGIYTYSDAEDDAEGISAYRWLRNGAVIRGSRSSAYALVTADSGQTITFEVTPVATTGTTIGNPVTSSALTVVLTPPTTPPIVNGLARYFDINANGIVDVNDQLVIPFDQPVHINGATSNDFSLPVSGDSLGTGAIVSASPADSEITITLGTAPSLKIRQEYNGTTTVNSPSGIDVSSIMMADVIEGLSGIDAQASMAIDVIPVYVDSAQSLGMDNTGSVTLGDIDSDGDLDMVVTNQSQGIRIFTNDGDGVFTDANQTIGANLSVSTALGDIDGDGDLDMVVAYSDGLSNKVYMNDGLGVFADSGQSLGRNVSLNIALGDLDNDGDLDIAVANSTQGNKIYRNDGNGVFTDSGHSLGSNDSRSIALGDIDSDGDLDMVVANTDPFGQGNSVYINDGNGNLSDSGQSLGQRGSYSVALGDLDRDGDLDMIVANANHGDKASRIYINDGSGSFTDSGQTLDTNHSFSVALGDIDDDGDLDIVMANYYSQADRVYYNDGNGGFTDSGQSLGAYDSVSVALGDVDGDGDIDLALANYRGSRVYFYSLPGT